MAVIANWFGDATQAGDWITSGAAGGDGIAILGNYFGHGASAIYFAGAATGVTIAGNKYDEVDYAVGPNGGSDFVIVANDMSSVVTLGVAFNESMPTRSLIVNATADTAGGPSSYALGLLFSVHGPVSDGAFPAPPPDSTIALDSPDNRLYVRNAGSWRFATFS